MKRLDGRVAVITGAASGIGEACARLFAAEGASVIGVDRNAERGETVFAELRQDGSEVAFVAADLGKEEDCRKAVEEAVSRYGTIDILLNNAGVFVGKLLHECTNDDFDKAMDINVKSVFWLCKYSIPHMLEQGGGVICTTASKTGLVAQYDSPLYCASKGAVVMLMKAIALDYAKKGIRANAICPGIIDTPLLDYSINLAEDPAAFRKWNEDAQPMGRLGTPEECARTALFLCSDESSFITGVALPIDGGFTAM